MRRRIVISIIGVAVIALLVLGVPLALAVERLYESQEVLKLEREANEARSSVSTSALQRGDRIRKSINDLFLGGAGMVAVENRVDKGLVDRPAVL